MKRLIITKLLLFSLVTGLYGANISTTTGLDQSTPWINVLQQLDNGNITLTLSGLTLGSSPVLTLPTIKNGLTATGSVANDFSGSTGAFKTSTGAVTIGPGAIGLTGTVTSETIAAGTATVAPTTYTAGTNLTVPVAGATEYDGTQMYQTLDTSSGRGAIDVEQYFHLTANGGAITTIGNFFGANSNPTIVASGYYILDCYFWYATTGTGTVVFTFTNSAAPTSQNIYWEMSPTTGMVAPPGTATMLVGQTLNDNTAARTITTGSLSAANHYAHVKMWIQNSTGTNIKIQATSNGTNLTPQLNSYWICRRISPNNIGSFSP